MVRRTLGPREKGQKGVRKEDHMTGDPAGAGGRSAGPSAPAITVLLHRRTFGIVDIHVAAHYKYVREVTGCECIPVLPENSIRGRNAREYGGFGQAGMMREFFS